jgi:hypothetical protein
MAVLAFNCGGGGSSSPTEPARRDTLALLSVEPGQGAHVGSGKRVPIRARFHYLFKDTAGGKIAVIATPAPIGLPILTDPLLAQAVVGTQEGEATLAFDLVLDDPDLHPVPKAIVMSFVLFPQGQTVSTTNVEVRYEVDP